MSGPALQEVVVVPAVEEVVPAPAPEDVVPRTTEQPAGEGVDVLRLVPVGAGLPLEEVVSPSPLEPIVVAPPKQGVVAPGLEAQLSFQLDGGSDRGLRLSVDEAALVRCPGSAAVDRRAPWHERVARLARWIGPSVAHAHGGDGEAATGVTRLGGPMELELTTEATILEPASFLPGRYCALRLTLARPSLGVGWSLELAHAGTVRRRIEPSELELETGDQPRRLELGIRFDGARLMRHLEQEPPEQTLAALRASIALFVTWAEHDP